MNSVRDKDILMYGAILALMFLVACIAYLAAVDCLGIETEVMRDRYWKNAYPLFHGEMPVMEYPPFALVFFAIPGLIPGGPWEYNIAYVAEVFVVVVIGLYLVRRLAGDMGFDPLRSMALYMMFILLLIEFVTDRYDIFPMVLTLASLVMFVEKRYGWAFMLLAVGMMTKLYPAVIVPIYMIWMFGKSDCKGAFRGAAVFALTAVIIAGAFWLAEPETLTGFLGYHSDRPLQLESVAASVLYPLSVIGLFDARIQLFADNDFGSDNLIGAFPDAAASLLMPLMALSIAVLWLVCLVRRRRFSSGGTGAIALAALMALMLFLTVNKVLSAQYLVWLVPFLVYIVMESDGSELSKGIGLMSALACLLTQAFFAYDAGWCVGDINGWGMTMILIRNIVLIALMLAVAKEMRSRISVPDGAGFPLSGRV